MGRNATMLVPATLEEMKKEIDFFGNPNGWGIEESDRYHQPSGQDHPNVKYTTFKGDEKKNTDQQKGYEAVYNKATGRIVTDEYMGTENLEPLYKRMRKWSSHYKKDMRLHKKHWFKGQFEKDGDQYKYVGILYERDPNNPDKFYIIDGQTGLPMTPRQVAEMPTTLSDMWKDMGLVCVKNDVKDVVKPREDGQPDLHSLDLDDPNGDWCKCEERGEKPGCDANMDPVKGYVIFGCTKCKKVNVKYAKMALELEQKMKDAGVQGTWFGQNAKANAHKAASKPSK